MKPPFSLLIVHGDGSRVLHVCLPRWIAYGTLGLAAAAATAMIGLSGGYVLFRRHAEEVLALRQRIDEKRALDSFQKRVAAVRHEITTWKALHAKMWKAFAPESGAVGVSLESSVPSPGASEPRPMGELDLLTSSVAEEGPRLRQLERVVSNVSKRMDALPLGWPVRGQVNSEYGLRRSPWGRRREHHDGIDIGSLPGTPVESPAAATVVAVSSHGGYGKNVVLDHGNGVRSRYAHLKKLDVKVGQRIEKGQVIGLVGSTGRSTGPHLHYEVLVDGKPVNPRGFLWQEPSNGALAHAAVCSASLALGPCANRAQ